MTKSNLSPSDEPEDLTALRERRKRLVQEFNEAAERARQLPKGASRDTLSRKSAALSHELRDVNEQIRVASVAWTELRNLESEGRWFGGSRAILGVLQAAIAFYDKSDAQAVYDLQTAVDLLDHDHEDLVGWLEGADLDTDPLPFRLGLRVIREGREAREGRTRATDLLDDDREDP